VTLTLDHREAESDRGGAGTMAVPIPPSVTQITGLRIAGAENKGGVTIRLYRGGWDRAQRRPIAEPKELLEGMGILAAEEPFYKEYLIKDTVLDPEYHTLSLWLWGKKRTSISLIAVEFVY
jgi:hypothetical protein